MEHPGEIPPNSLKASWAASRKRLFGILGDLVTWENTTNDVVIEKARAEIRKSWRETCELNKDHPQAAQLFNPDKLPALHDPFAGGGTIPLEAQRLGLEAFASDLNPVAVLINKAMIEIPPKFAGTSPVNPDWQRLTPGEKLLRQWQGAQGLAEDVRYYGQWMRDKVQRRIGHLYPTIEITADIAKTRRDLTPLVGKRLTVIAWLWARTVRSPNPAFADIDVPLVSTFLLASKPGKEAYVEPMVEAGKYIFTVKAGKPKHTEESGTKAAPGGNFRCLMSSTPIAVDYIRAEAKAGRMGARMMAIVAEGDRERVYLSPTADMEAIALEARPEWKPDVEFFQQALGFRVGNYGMTKWSDLFTDRQLVALTTFSDSVQEVRHRIEQDGLASGLANDGNCLDVGGTGALAYADAVSVYLAFAMDKSSVYWNSLCPWLNQPKNEIVGNSFSRQTVQMVWDYAEANPFCDSGGNIDKQLDYVCKVLATYSKCVGGRALQADAASQTLSSGCVVSCDPPYFDNIGYADLSDFFYVWLRRALRPMFPRLFATLTTPKAEELVATPHRHGGKDNAEEFFLGGMTRALKHLAEQAHPAFPVTIFYAFKQSEPDGEKGTSNTGWETFLEAVIRAGFSITGTWPIRTERPGRMRDHASNALASSVVLACCARSVSAPTSSRRAFIRELNRVLPEALDEMTRGSGDERSPVAPVDLSQSIIGPGMAIFSKYAAVLEADGLPMTVKTALTLINRFLAEDDFDADTQFCLHWFQQYGWKEGKFGDADTLARAKGTSVDGVKQAGVLFASGGLVRLFKWKDYPTDWDPKSGVRTPVWEVLHQIIRVFKTDGESGAGGVLGAVRAKTEGNCSRPWFCGSSPSVPSDFSGQTSRNRLT
jgi:putative DNA methylase